MSRGRGGVRGPRGGTTNRARTDRLAHLSGPTRSTRSTHPPSPAGPGVVAAHGDTVQTLGPEHPMFKLVMGDHDEATKNALANEALEAGFAGLLAPQLGRAPSVDDV